MQEDLGDAPPGPRCQNELSALWLWRSRLFSKQRTEQPTPALALAWGSAAPSLEVEGSQWLEPLLGQARATSSRCGKDKAVLEGKEEKKLQQEVEVLGTDILSKHGWNPRLSPALKPLRLLF